MNKLQNIFKIEERGKRNVGKERAAMLLYCIFDPVQTKYLGRHFRSFKKGRSPISDKKPWLSYKSIDYLDSILKKDMRVFEWGSGGSTLYLSSRVKEVISVEHDKEWFKNVKKQLDKDNVSNVKYILKPPKKSVESGNHEYFRSTKEPGLSFKDYVLSISSFPDNYFDLVIVDGRARVLCVREAYSKVKDKGYLVLDNSERPDYHEAFLFMKHKKRYVKNFFGLIGYTTTMVQTTFWKIKK